ncbi:hypothetical protein FLACOL_00248 [Flavobacterium columnare]|uniref:Uncharacterized protein n=2 Tax=Flavobacterium TaxID=237 RepID=A0A246GEP1_9FLAO|nr:MULTISPECIES: hypothetical protein [Flavobacterium]OWP82579.1 hypothetical protein BWK59_15135 [Flavobacterium davisii]SPE76270.1 hypothetical protein FLACOL_00248 [Flavobacterium columnare]
MKYKDELVFIDNETGEKLIFNFNTWIEVIKGIIVKYTNKDSLEAEDLIMKRNFLMPETYNQVIFYSHDTEYHWAMLLVYGDNYWLNGINSDEPIDYLEWDQEYRKVNSLKEESFEFV